MANTHIFRSLPTNEVGATITGNSSTSWGESQWRVVAKRIPTDIYLAGITWQYTYVGAADSTFQYVLEVGIGNPDNATVILQYPNSHRNDTAVGYYLQQDSLFLPETITIKEGSTICVRYRSQITAGNPTMTMKLLYQSNTEINNANANRVGFNNYLFVHGVGSGGEVIR